MSCGWRSRRVRCTAPLLFFNENAFPWRRPEVSSLGRGRHRAGVARHALLAYAYALYAGLDRTLVLDEVLRETASIVVLGCTGAFILLFVGYRTKMGLRDAYWKPDAYGRNHRVWWGALGGLTSYVFGASPFFQICVRRPMSLPLLGRFCGRRFVHLGRRGCSVRLVLRATTSGYLRTERRALAGALVLGTQGIRGARGVFFIF